MSTKPSTSPATKISLVNVAHNQRIVYYAYVASLYCAVTHIPRSRVFVSIIAGCAAGVLGLTGLLGLLLFVVANGLVGGALLQKMKFNSEVPSCSMPASSFAQPFLMAQSAVFTEGLWPGLQVRRMTHLALTICAVLRAFLDVGQAAVMPLTLCRFSYNFVHVF